jgi:hypothetical protein
MYAGKLEAPRTRCRTCPQLDRIEVAMDVHVMHVSRDTILTRAEVLSKFQHRAKHHKLHIPELTGRVIDRALE